MVMARLVFATLGLAALAGCMETSEITSAPVKMSYKAAAKGLTANTIAETEIRTAVKGPDGKRVEKLGVPCSIDTVYYTAAITTPVKARLPSFAEKTPVLRIACVYEGKTYTSEARAFNKTASDRTAAYGGGLLTAAIVSATTKAENSVFIYPNITVDLFTE